MLHIECLVEDPSGEILLNKLLEKITAEYDDVSYRCHKFHGVGHIPKGSSVSEVKTGCILNDLPLYVSSLSKSLAGISSLMVVIVDNDNNEPEEFIRQVNELVSRYTNLDNIVCLAIEEIEAWLLGDTEAIRAVYPQVRDGVLRSYVQDSICGTWELLANAIYPGGMKKLKKDALGSYHGIGKVKCEWADKIGEKMNIHSNRSPSFNYFIDELYRRLDPVRQA